jgi:hypothetical protein
LFQKFFLLTVAGFLAVATQATISFFLGRSPLDTLIVSHESVIVKGVFQISLKIFVSLPSIHKRENRLGLFISLPLTLTIIAGFAQIARWQIAQMI